MVPRAKPSLRPPGKQKLENRSFFRTLQLMRASSPGPVARKTRCGSVSPAGKWAPCDHWSLRFSINSDHHPQAALLSWAPGSVGRPGAWWHHQRELLRIIFSSRYISYVLDTALSSLRVPFLFILKMAHVRVRSWGPAPGLPPRDTPLGMSPCWQHHPGPDDPLACP